MKELVNQYLDLFYAGSDPGELKKLFTEDLQFDGPYLNTSTADDYIQALKSGTPTKMSYEVIKSYADADSVSSVYRVKKGAKEFPISQVFWFKSNKISKILTVFDSNMAGK